MKAETKDCALEANILAACPVPVVAINAELELVYFNDTARCMFCGEKESLPRSILAILPGLRDLDRAAFGSPDGIWLLHGADRDGLQIMARGRDGTFPVELGVRSVHEGDEELTIVAIHDMRGLNNSLSGIMKAHRELAEFNRVAIGREIRMVALKEEINELLVQMGRSPRYLGED